MARIKELIEPEWRALCRVEEIGDGESKGFPPARDGFVGLFAVRKGERVFVYVNSCPHIGVPLNWRNDDFLTLDKIRIICATHGAEFRIVSGECLLGPCAGEHLDAIVTDIRDGVIFVPPDAGL
ncbi:MAG: Rieske (2Fe-2S) protein [Acetobacteraceae bacterium]|nr:Rieske (2Fe-2S) protein [Acetobacteraceae bacterium]MSP30473.1 Rieske (2Fe-2S) protein [Acetobacteraceae bacterium]